jgi:cytochrome c oxidase assembly protein subunit 15
VRLADAALGWPGCYGQLTAPTNSEAMAAAAFPDRPLEHPKASKQMVHRYLAGTLGLAAILGLAVTALAPAPAPMRAPSLLVGLTESSGPMLLCETRNRRTGVPAILYLGLRR